MTTTTTAITMTTMPTTPIVAPIQTKTAASKGVAKLKWEGTPRQTCIVTRETSASTAMPRAPINSQLSERRVGRKLMTHVRQRVVIPKEKPKLIALRQEKGPVQGRLSIKKTPVWKTPLAIRTAATR